MIDVSSMPPLRGVDWAVKDGESNRSAAVAQANRFFGDCPRVLVCVEAEIRRITNPKWWYKGHLWAYTASHGSVIEEALPLLWHKWGKDHRLAGWRKLRDQILGIIKVALTPAQRSGVQRLCEVLMAMTIGTELEPDDHAVAQSCAALPVEALPPIAAPAPVWRPVPLPGAGNPMRTEDADQMARFAVLELD